MSIPFTIETPRYSVQDESGQHLSAFAEKDSAIIEAISMALEYSGSTFNVIESVNWEERIIFSFQIKFQFIDAKLVYQSVVNILQKKLDKIKFWRKK